MTDMDVVFESKYSPINIRDQNNIHTDENAHYVCVCVFFFLFLFIYFFLLMACEPMAS
jgi:hypothetical protein